MWAEGYRTASKHEISILSLKGRHWKWRMHGAAVTLAREFIEKMHCPDLIVATDMLDLATFLGLTRKETAHIPVALYFHENQLTYPRSAKDTDDKMGRDAHYAFLNFTSALSADKVFFNSWYHHDSFLSELPEFLKKYPDHNELDAVEAIRVKSKVLHLGMDLKVLKLDDLPTENSKEAPAVILWNHRWEYDKNPEAFFNALFELKERDVAFSLVVLGESYSRTPSIFDLAKDRLADRILHWGFCESRNEYAKWLYRSDIIPVTSNQDFFGGSVVEAIFCNTIPLVPDRLAFKEHIPESEHDRFVYGKEEDLADRIQMMCEQVAELRTYDTRIWVEKYDWEIMSEEYDRQFSMLVNNGCIKLY